MNQPDLLAAAVYVSAGFGVLLLLKGRITTQTFKYIDV
jgi:hypothetical protein